MEDPSPCFQAQRQSIPRHIEYLDYLTLSEALLSKARSVYYRITSWTYGL